MKGKLGEKNQDLQQRVTMGIDKEEKHSIEPKTMTTNGMDSSEDNDKNKDDLTETHDLKKQNKFDFKKQPIIRSGKSSKNDNENNNENNNDIIDKQPNAHQAPQPTETPKGEPKGPTKTPTDEKGIKEEQTPAYKKFKPRAKCNY